MSFFPHVFGNDVKNVGFFGLGRSNLSLLSMLLGSDISVTLRSDKKIDRGILPKKLKIKAIYEGDAAFAELCEDTLVLSPSVRRERFELSMARERGVCLTSDAEMFFEQVSAPVYAVSGSDGKSTTATLTHLLLGGEAGGTGLCGNVGEPMLGTLARDLSRYVTELSSFMLRYILPRSERAAITNITPNHLDWHADFEEYRAAKLGIYEKTREPVINLDDSHIRDTARLSAFAAVTDKISFSEAALLTEAEVIYTVEGGFICRNGTHYLELTDVRRREAHNLKNLMLALALTDGKRFSDAREVAREFGGLPHRFEWVGECEGVRFINSSIDTSPARCATTLSSLTAPAVVILGGRGKGLSFEPIREPLGNFGRAAVLLGESREEIIKALPEGLPYLTASSMEEAVMLARGLARRGDIVLLSPAATSYDSYRSFEERGDNFKTIVKEYCDKRSKTG